MYYIVRLLEFHIGCLKILGGDGSEESSSNDCSDVRRCVGEQSDSLGNEQRLVSQPEQSDESVKATHNEEDGAAKPKSLPFEEGKEDSTKSSGSYIVL